MLIHDKKHQEYQVHPASSTFVPAVFFPKRLIVLGRIFGLAAALFMAS